MAVSCSSSFKLKLIRSTCNVEISKPLMWKGPIALRFPRYSLSHLVPSSPSICYCCPRIVSCCSSSSSSSSLEAEVSPSTTIFIRGLAQSTTEGQLKKAFSEFGEVTRVKIMMEKKSMRSLGFAFVWFSGDGSVELAVKEMNGKFFDGRFISVAPAKPGTFKPRERMRPYKF